MKRALVAACLCAALVGGIVLIAPERPQTVVATGAATSLDDLRRAGIEQHAAEAQFVVEQTERDAAGAAYREQLEQQERAARIAQAQAEARKASRSAPKVRVPQAPRPQVEVSGDLLDRLAMCESGMNPQKNTGNGFYGAFQFMLSTWHGLGMSGNPVDHSYAVQKEVVRTKIPVSSWRQQFPGCSRKLGVR